jgi:hypothetical protein
MIRANQRARGCRTLLRTQTSDPCSRYTRLLRTGTPPRRAATAQTFKQAVCANPANPIRRAHISDYALDASDTPDTPPANRARRQGLSAIDDCRSLFAGLRSPAMGSPPNRVRGKGVTSGSLPRRSPCLPPLCVRAQDRTWSNSLFLCVRGGAARRVSKISSVDCERRVHPHVSKTRAL